MLKKNSNDGPNISEVIKEVERVLEKKLSAIVTEDFTAAVVCRR